MKIGRNSFWIPEGDAIDPRYVINVRLFRWSNETARKNLIIFFIDMSEIEEIIYSKDYFFCSFFLDFRDNAYISCWQKFCDENGIGWKEIFFSSVKFMLISPRYVVHFFRLPMAGRRDEGRKKKVKKCIRNTQSSGEWSSEGCSHGTVFTVTKKNVREVQTASDLLWYNIMWLWVEGLSRTNNRNTKVNWHGIGINGISNYILRTRDENKSQWLEGVALSSSRAHTSHYIKL